jgi:hypothetical protein
MSHSMMAITTTRRHRLTVSLRLGQLAASLCFATTAQAQSHSCELLKQTLAARIPPEIKGYSMEDVPARTPVPAGGKVIGTCEGGARKVVYRRFGGPPLVAADGTAPPASAAAPAPAKPPVAAAPPPPPRPVAASAPAPKPPPAPASAAVRAPVPPPAKPLPTAASAAPAPKPAPAAAPAAPPVPTKVTTATVTPSATPSVPPLLMPPAGRTEPALAASATEAPDEEGFLSAYGPWLLLLLAMPSLAWLWAWVSHRLAYDSAGLPRGPRL